MTDTERRRTTQLLSPNVILHREKGGAFYSGSSRDVLPTHQIHEEPLDCGCRTLGFRTFRPFRLSQSPREPAPDPRRVPHPLVGAVTG